MFDAKGNQKQMEIWKLWADKVHTHICASGCKGFGKTYVALSIILSQALTYPNTRYFYCRSKLNDLRKFTLPDATNILENTWKLDKNYYSFNAQDNYFKFHNGSIVYFIGADWMPSDPNYIRFGSIQVTAGVFEEAGSIPREAYSNLCAAVGRWMNKEYDLPGKVLIISNPSNNWIFTDYYKPWRDGVLEPHKAFVLGTLRDNKQLPESYYENLERTLSNNEKQRLLYGRFEFDDNPNLLVDYESVCDVFTNQPEGDDQAISVDIATLGEDRAVIIRWVGTAAYIESVTHKVDLKTTLEKIQDISNKHHIGRSQIIYDADGVGMAVSGWLSGAVAFHNGGRAVDNSKYANAKSEVFYKLAELIRERKLRIYCDDDLQETIKNELMLLIGKDRPDSTYKLAVISKDEMKENISRSPDILDCLAYGCYRFVKSTTKGIRHMTL